MDDIRCPMCGKPNPATAEYCRFCQTRLTPADQPDDLPDWLRDVTGSGSAESATPGEEPPDWLARIRNLQKDEEPAVPAEETPVASNDDWLAQLRDNQGGEPVEPLQAQPEPPAEDDWLSRLGSLGESAEPFGGAPVEPQTPGLPDWMGGAENTPAAAAPQASEEEDLNAWLHSFNAEPESPQQPAAVEPAGDEELPDWLKSTPAVEPASEPLGETPDWFTSAASNPPEESVPQPTPGEETPDWLAAYTSPDEGRDLTASETPAAEAPAQPAAAGEAPTWLSAFDTSEESTPAEAVESDLPDWLKAAPASAEPALTASAGQDDDSWLNVFGAAEESALQGETPAEPLQAVPGGQAAATPAFLSGDDWEIPAEATPTEGVLPFLEGQVPDWLTSETAEPQPVEALSAREPFESQDLPDWIEPEPAQAEQTAAPAGEGAPGESLEPAQLPGWLQAMRPVRAIEGESAGPEQNRIEKSGPLAGMRGLVNGEEVVSQFRRPPAYAIKLRVTERQRINATILDNIVQAEAQPLEIRPERFQTPKLLIRLLAAVVLILAVVGGLLAGAPAAGPSLFPAETVAFQSAIKALPQNAPVLLAVEYEPGLSGEMRLSATGVVQDLMARQARLVTVSTGPAGPALAQDLLNTARAAQTGYSLADNVLPLGFLPGGVTSLQELAARMHQAMPYALDSNGTGQDAWSRPVAQGLNSVADFAAVIVLTDNADTARAWIEQVQPALAGKPLLIVSSAQAAPVIRAYTQGGQVQGLVAGLSGGMAYDQLQGGQGAVRNYWSAYQAAMLVAAAAILIGILIRAIALLFPRRGQKSEA